MTDTKKEAMRADCEAFFKKQFHSRLDRNMPDKSYNDPLANTSWFVWQAATAQATAAERERCAKVCEYLGIHGYGDWKHASPLDCSKAIRKIEAPGAPE